MLFVNALFVNIMIIIFQPLAISDYIMLLTYSWFTVRWDSLTTRLQSYHSVHTRLVFWLEVPRREEDRIGTEGYGNSRPLSHSFTSRIPHSYLSTSHLYTHLPILISSGSGVEVSVWRENMVIERRKPGQDG